MQIRFENVNGDELATHTVEAERVTIRWPNPEVEDDRFEVSADDTVIAHNDGVNPGLWLPGTGLGDVAAIEITAAVLRDDPDGVAAERGLRPHVDNEGYES